MSGAVTLVDAHSHFHPEVHAVPAWLDAARKRFDSVARGVQPSTPIQRVLLVADLKGQDTLEELERAGFGTREGWSRPEPNAAWWQHEGGDPLLVIGGRQLVSRERLEVLSFGSPAAAEAEGGPIEELVEASVQSEALTILPWGFGKWVGARGRRVRSLLMEIRSPRLFVGDSGGRPQLTPTPSTLRHARSAGIYNLPGSDPLPLAEQEERVASRGVILEAALERTRPFQSLRAALEGLSEQPRTFGTGTGPLAFIAAQMRLRQTRS